MSDPYVKLTVSRKNEVKKSSKERWSKMTTLEKMTVCLEHSPNLAISEYCDEQFTFCEVCEQNIERSAVSLNAWGEWKVTL
jgi:hypothetical protein